jgi:hypothetical protein
MNSGADRIVPDLRSGSVETVAPNKPAAVKTKILCKESMDGAGIFASN